jgi:hypothetical protein
LTRTLPEVLEDVFAFYGAILEKTGETSLEFLAPEAFARKIGIPEHGQLTFEYSQSGGNAVYAFYDSDFFKSLGEMLSENNRFAVARHPSTVTSVEKLSKNVPERTTFLNAISRYDTVERRTIGYLLVYFKYVALSDEKREGLLPLLINELNYSVAAYDQGLGALLNQLRGADRQTGGTANVSMDTLEHAHAAASEIVRERVGDFVKSLDRRLNRDVKRIYEYYETLKQEAERLIEKKGRVAGDSEDDQITKLLPKISAIETERQWKIQDLISKYALKIRLDPVLVLRITTEVPVFWIHIKRRLLTREFPFTYNPLLRQFDGLPCEACFYPQGGHYVCDEKLHILCAKCFKTCPQCNRQYCGACHKNGCPRCKATQR